MTISAVSIGRKLGEMGVFGHRAGGVCPAHEIGKHSSFRLISGLITAQAG